MSRSSRKWARVLHPEYCHRRALRTFSLTTTKLFVDTRRMSRSPVPKPTDAELAILRILWERGPSTVRQVHDLLARDRQGAYTTALKLLQIMTEKGLVERDERERTHVYRARLSEDQTQRQLVGDLPAGAFGGPPWRLSSRPP